MTYPEDTNKTLWLCILVLLLVAIGAMLAGCGEARSPAPEPTPVGVFGSIGATLAWAGGISAAAGLALSLISLFYAPLQPFAIIFRLLGIGGAGVSVTGAAYLWIANHYWWVLTIAALVGVGVGWWFWPRIHRVLDRRLRQS